MNTIVDLFTKHESLKNIEVGNDFTFYCFEKNEFKAKVAIVNNDNEANFSLFMLFYPPSGHSYYIDYYYSKRIKDWVSSGNNSSLPGWFKLLLSDVRHFIDKRDRLRRIFHDQP